MRVSVLQENLARGLSIVTRAVPGRPQNPILSNVLLATEDGRLKMAATNLELGITMRIGAKVDSDGGIAIPARTLSDLVNTLPPERIDLELDPRTNTLNLRCGTFVANIKGVDAEQFPVVPVGDADTGVELPAPLFRTMIDQVVFAAAKEDNRPILMGVQARFDGTRFTMVSADGFRMALRATTLEVPVGGPLSLIIPAKALSEVSRIAGNDESKVYISVAPSQNQVMFHLDDVDIVSALIDGKFPDVENLIPKNATTTTVMQADDLLLACRRAEIFAREANYTTRLRIKPGDNRTGQVIVTAQSQETGDNEGTIDANINGQGLEVAFNVRYLLDVLAVMDADQVSLETSGAAAPGVIKPAERNDFVYVVMPMSVR